MGEAFPLHTAARNKDIEAMKELIAGGLTDINQIDKLKRTALHIASWAGCSDAVKLLLGSNASTELKAMDGFTALHFASQSNSIEAPLYVFFYARLVYPYIYQVYESPTPLLRI